MTLAALITAVVVTSLITPTYSGSVTLCVLFSNSSIGADEYYNVQYADRLMETYVRIATSAPLLEELVQRLNLADLPAIEVEAVPATELITITVSSEDPRLAANAANTLGDILIERSKASAEQPEMTPEALLQQLQQAETELTDARRQYEALLAEPAPDPARVEALRANLEARQDAYITLAEQYQRLSSADTLRARTVYVVEPASVPESPTRPQAKLNLFLGMVLGLLAGTALSFVLEMLDSRLDTVSQIIQTTDLPVLGMIPSSQERPPQPLFQLHSASAEAIRRLFTRLLPANNGEDDLQVLLVTSAEPQEGKSTITANLAVTSAQAGRKVTLIDADRYRPTIHRIFDLPNDSGLDSVLRHETGLMQALQPIDSLPRLTVLTSGPCPDSGDPGDVQQMEDLIDQLRRRSDLVLIDAPAFLAVNDSAALAPMVDGVLVVVRSGQAHREAVAMTCQQLAASQSPVVGAVINRTAPRHDHYHYYSQSSRNGASGGRGFDPGAHPLINAGNPGAEFVAARSRAALLPARQRVTLRPTWLHTIRWRTLLRWETLAVIALVLWFGAQVVIQRANHTISGIDPVIYYFPTTQNLLAGQGYHAFEADALHGPAYPLLLAGVVRLFQVPIFTGAQIVNILVSTLFLIASFLLLRRVFGALTALAALLVIGGLNSFNWTAASSGTDVLFALFAVASLYFLARTPGPQRYEMALAGACAGLAVTARWEGLLLLPFGLLRLLFISGSAFRLRAKALLLVLFLTGFMLVSSPWLYVNNRLHGDPLYNENVNSSVIDTQIFPESASSTGDLVRVFMNDPIHVGWKLVSKAISQFPSVLQGFNLYPAPGGWLMAGLFWALVIWGLTGTLLRANRVIAWLLLVGALWWLWLAAIHYETRFYLSLIPLLCALPVHLLTGGFLPDVHLAAGDRHARFSVGSLLAPLTRTRQSHEASSVVTGLSVTAVLLLGVLLLSQLDTLQRTHDGLQALNESKAAYPEISAVVRAAAAGGEMYPVGVRQWSQARYWLPSEAGVTAAPFPIGQSYERSLADLSYVLYDQLNETDSVVEWWDDPALADLSDPLHAPSTLEAVYYKSSPQRAILYRILKENHPASLVGASGSSFFSGFPAALAADDDAQTWWASALHPAAQTAESITVEFAATATINHVWLLPAPGGDSFPHALRIELSADGDTWQTAAEVSALARPVQQSPQIVSFAAAPARWLRVTALELGPDTANGHYAFKLAEIRGGLAVPQSTQVPVFSMSADDLSLDAAANALVVLIHNDGAAAGSATLSLYEGWQLGEDTRPLAAVTTRVIEPGDTYQLHLDDLRWDPPLAGECRPIWAVLRVLSSPALKLDTYGTAPPADLQTFAQVCANSS